MRRWPKKKPAPAEGDGGDAQESRVDVFDLLLALGVLMFAFGLLIWFGPGPMLTVAGLGLLGFVALVEYLGSRPPRKTEG